MENERQCPVLPFHASIDAELVSASIITNDGSVSGIVCCQLSVVDNMVSVQVLVKDIAGIGVITLHSCNTFFECSVRFEVVGRVQTIGQVAPYFTEIHAFSIDLVADKPYLVVVFGNFRSGIIKVEADMIGQVPDLIHP